MSQIKRIPYGKGHCEAVHSEGRDHLDKTTGHYAIRDKIVASAPDQLQRHTSASKVVIIHQSHPMVCRCFQP